MALCWFIAAGGMIFTSDSHGDTAQLAGGYTAVVAICLFLFFYAIGIGSTPWALNSEIYPLHVIGTANSLAATTNWVTNAAVSEVFKLVTEISLTWEIIVYVGLGLFALLGWLFTYCMIPETAGKPIE